MIAGRLAKGRKLPVIVSERFCDLSQGMGLMEQIVRQAYRLASHVIVNSYHQMDNFVQKYPFLRRRISTIYNGYDLTSFIPPTHDRLTNSSKSCALQACRHTRMVCAWWKPLTFSSKKYKALFHVSWIGQRVMAGERLVYLREMKSKIQQYSLGEYWHWLDQRTDIVQQLHQHDVLVHPSYGEGLPNVVCEALACGRPVILSNTLDRPRLVQDGQSGYLFDWRDPSDLAGKIMRFNELSCEERANLGKKGRQFAEAHLSMDRYVDEYERLFMNLLNGKQQ